MTLADIAAWHRRTEKEYLAMERLARRGAVVGHEDAESEAGGWRKRAVLHATMAATLEAPAQPAAAPNAPVQPNSAAEDTARLDWLEKNPRLSTIVVNGKSEPCYLYGVAGAAGVRLREIVDAARAAQEGES